MPLKSQLHVNKLLSNVSVQYQNAEYIWDKIFPVVNVTKDTDLYRVYDRNFKLPETKRAPKAVANEYTFYFSNNSYSLNQDALKDYIGVDEQENNDLGSLQTDTTEFLTDKIYMKMEIAAASLFTTANWSLNLSLASTAKFNVNTITSDPVPVFDTAASTIAMNSGKMPNFGILPRNGMVACKNHVSILDRIKYTSDKITPMMLAGLFELPELHIPMAIKDTANEGEAANMGFIFDDFAFLGWKPKSAGLKIPSSGYTFVSKTPRVRTWFDQERNADVVEVEVKSVPKVVASLTGFLISDIT